MTDSTIGVSQIRLASVSLIPPAVGHVVLGCSGTVGGLTAGGGAMLLAVITSFLTMSTRLETQITLTLSITWAN